VFKKELLYVPFFGWSMARMDMIHIDRSQGAQAFNKVVNRGASGCWRRASGSSCSPRARAFRAGRPATYKTGGTRLACECGVPVIPIAVTSAKVLASQGVHQAPGHRRHVDRASRSPAWAASPTS
jgi:1-acyl-sn-glycerol-3-phosphate acyltransferase